VDFKNTVIIMTSNAASHIIKAMVGQDPDDVRDAVMSELDNTFRPEFLNRIDEIVLFHSLTQEDIMLIVDIQLERLGRLLAERRMSIVLSDAAKAYLAQRGYDPVFGARPLKRMIQREVQDPLARHLLEGTIREGETIYVDLNEDGTELVFSSAEPEMVH
jgi:ATP-dependent Clp protease ATP-binding subunit ClpB